MSAADAFPDAISPITFGTGGITDPNNAEHHRVTRMAMSAGVWFHVADYGGGVYTVLERAFRESRAHRPHCIVKVDGTSAETLKNTVVECLDRTGLERISVGQVCAFPYCEDREALFTMMDRLRNQGLVGAWVMDVIPAYSEAVIESVELGCFQGYIFYYSAMEREITNRAYDVLVARDIPIVAMRTFGGRGLANYFKGVEANPRKRALMPIMQASPCSSPLDFLVRFPISLPNVVSTVGSTSVPANLDAFLHYRNVPRPLPAATVNRVLDLHREWAEGFGD